MGDIRDPIDVRIDHAEQFAHRILAERVVAFDTIAQSLLEETCDARDLSAVLGAMLSFDEPRRHRAVQPRELGQKPHSNEVG